MPAPLAMRRPRDVLLMLMDIAVGVGVARLAYRLRFEDVTVPAPLAERYWAATFVVALLLIVAGRASGLYRRGAVRAGVTNVPEAFEAGVLVGVGLYLVNVVFYGGDLSRAWIGLVAFGAMISGIVTRGAVRRGRRLLVPFGIGLERYALVGDDAGARRLYDDLTRAPGAPFRIVERLRGDQTPEDLAASALRLRVDGLVVPAGALTESDAARLAASLSGAGVDVLLAPGLRGLDLRVASVAMLHGVPLLRAAGLTPRRRAVRQRELRSRRGVAILGTRGIPANYGGFETFAERLALDLVAAGVPVAVYCRSHYATAGREWRGIRLVTLPTIRNKYLDTVVHTALSSLHLVLRTRIRDVVLCNSANAPTLPLLRAAGRRVILNVDGLEWRRTKWGIAGRAWYRMGEWMSVRMASVLVTDAEEVRTYYRVRHDADSVMIPYGADLLTRGEPPLPPELAVEQDCFFLYVSRWEPENNPDLVAEAHARSGVTLPLVMLGGATYDDAIEARVRAVAAPHAVLPGPLFGDDYLALQAGARAYIHATEVGGTHPALIEALGAGNPCLVLDTPENREVAGDAARYFADAEELAELLREVAALTPRKLSGMRKKSREYAAAHFSWSVVNAAYLELLRGSEKS